MPKESGRGPDPSDDPRSRQIAEAALQQPEFERFEGSENPLVYTPGDNEWTDCHRLPNPTPEEADPLNRLELVRRIFFATDESLGQKTIPLERRSTEYACWGYGSVTFATLHIVGSNNDRPTAANPAIGNEAEDNGSAGVMLIIQANPFEEDTNEPSGFTDFRETLARETVSFGKPVVLVHGDSHTFRIDRPMFDPQTGAPIQNFTRVETFGSPDVHWVRTSVDTRDPDVFSFQPEMVEENVVGQAP